LPLEVFEQVEQAALQPWSGEPYVVPERRTGMVHPDHHVVFRYALYSVPSHRCPPGTRVEIAGDRALVRITHQGVLVKVHARQPPGGRATDPNDYPPERVAYALRSPERLHAQAVALGPNVGAFVQRLVAPGGRAWTPLRQ